MWRKVGPGESKQTTSRAGFSCLRIFKSMRAKP